MNGGIITEYHRMLIQLKKVSVFKGGTDPRATTCEVVIEVGKGQERLTSRSRVVEWFFTTFQVLPCSGRMQESSWPAKLFSPRDLGMPGCTTCSTCLLRAPFAFTVMATEGQAMLQMICLLTYISI